MRSLRKRNATLCAILDMKVSNTDIIDTAADEKKLNMCLIQGWCYKKSLSTVPKSENYAIERCRRLALRSVVPILSLSNLMFIFSQSGFQSGLETAPLAAVSAGYCHSSANFKLEVELRYIFQKRFFTKSLSILPINYVYSIKFRFC